MCTYILSVVLCLDALQLIVMIQKPSKWFAFIEKQLIVLDTSFDLKKLLVLRIAEYMCATFLSNCCKGKCQCLIDHLISSNFAEKF